MISWIPPVLFKSPNGFFSFKMKSHCSEVCNFRVFHCFSPQRTFSGSDMINQFLSTSCKQIHKMKFISCIKYPKQLPDILPKDQFKATFPLPIITLCLLQVLVYCTTREDIPPTLC